MCVCVKQSIVHQKYIKFVKKKKKRIIYTNKCIYSHILKSGNLQLLSERAISTWFNP